MNKHFLAVTAASAIGLASTNSASAAAPRPILSSEINTADAAKTVFYLGLDSNLHQISNSRLAWSTEPLTGAGAGPAVAAGTGAEAHVKHGLWAERGALPN